VSQLTKVFVVLNQHDSLLGVYSTESEARMKAEVFTNANREHGDINSAHRVVEYISASQNKVAGKGDSNGDR
jgi:hypothetical protein